MTEPGSAVDDGGEFQIEGLEPPTPGGWKDYPLDELAIRDERRTAVDVVRRIDKGRFVLDPEFQRDFVWNGKKQSRLIESILMRIPLPVFYVAEDSEGRLVVVDGRQRLTTLQRFLTGSLSLELPDRPELHKKHFTDLDDRLQNRVEDCQLLFYIIDTSVPEQARLDIFERVNGGEVLTRQQMRNALYNGPATAFLRDESRTSIFIEATGSSLKPGIMQDREFVNRFCSFSLLPIEAYKGDWDDWLKQGLIELGKRSDADRQKLSQKFRTALKNNYEVFGKHAFRKHRNPFDRRSLINASLFDVMTYYMADVAEGDAAAKAQLLRDKFQTLIIDDDFVKSITFGTNAPARVKARFDLAEKMFQEVFGA